jgi:hypothetical protein
MPVRRHSGSSAAIPPDLPHGVDRSRFGPRPGLHAGLRSPVRFETDTRTDPAGYLSEQVTATFRGGRAVATDPLSGVSPWGVTTTFGGCL